MSCFHMFVNLKEGRLDELLHIPEPWYIRKVEFSLEAKQLDVYVKFRKRALFPCAKCGEPNQPVRDIANHDRTWRHLNFFEYGALSV
ncbi:hypothetical protein J6TS7_28560 [Paenibacillus dendritiformis]|nr:hypothetical protein J6TS7_28560 [Paenibacillus dendritiformis]